MVHLIVVFRGTSSALSRPSPRFQFSLLVAVKVPIQYININYEIEVMITMSTSRDGECRRRSKLCIGRERDLENAQCLHTICHGCHKRSDVFTRTRNEELHALHACTMKMNRPFITRMRRLEAGNKRTSCVLVIGIFHLKVLLEAGSCVDTSKEAWIGIDHRSHGGEQEGILAVDVYTHQVSRGSAGKHVLVM